MGNLLYTAGSTAGALLISRFQHGGAADITDYDPDDDGNPDALTAWIAAHQDTLAQAVHSHTGDMLTEALAAALLTASGSHAGDTVTHALASATNDLYDQWTGQSGTGSDYAGALADDWTVLGWNAGEYDAAGQAQAASGDGVSVERTWTATMDARTRPEHAAADGQTVDLHDTFNVGGESLLYPGDPNGSAGNTIGCRCQISYALSNGQTVDATDVDAAAE